MAVDFLAEIIQLVYAKTAFQVSAAINAGRGMALEVDQVAAVAFAFSVPEVVLAATYHGGQRGERRNVPAPIAAVGRVVAVGLDDHGHGVGSEDRRGGKEGGLKSRTLLSPAY